MRLQFHVATKFLIGGELRPFPAPAAPVVQYQVGLWAQHRAK
jgi:hypothetical protein